MLSVDGSGALVFSVFWSKEACERVSVFWLFNFPIRIIPPPTRSSKTAKMAEYAQGFGPELGFFGGLVSFFSGGFWLFSGFL